MSAAALTRNSSTRNEDLTTLPLELPIDDRGSVYPLSTHARLKPLFDETIVHPAIIVPARRTAEIRRNLSHVLMQRPKMKDVHEVLPNELLHGEDAKSVRKLALKLSLSTSTARCGATDSIYTDPALRKLLDEVETIRRSTHTVRICYDTFTVDEILRRVLPKSITEVPSSFETAGHLAHINLREDLLPYKHIIGQTMLDKNRGVGIVVNKIGTIENEFRTFPMEILARQQKEGAECSNYGTATELEVELREEGCRFRLDFAKVYWNSRLQFEHRRLVNLIAGKERVANERAAKKKGKKRGREEDENIWCEDYPKVIVADIMAGVGPFSVPLAARFRNITCHANDLNPISFRYLEHNSKLNRCGEKTLVTYNMDGRSFVHHLEQQGVWFDHAIMNLPANAPEFLDAFRGWNGFRHKPGGRPLIHVHCFNDKDDEGNCQAVARCERALKCNLDRVTDEVSIHIVRDVSPKKNMVCVSFRMPLAVKEVAKITLTTKH